MQHNFDTHNDIGYNKVREYFINDISTKIRSKTKKMPIKFLENFSGVIGAVIPESAMIERESEDGLND